MRGAIEVEFPGSTLEQHKRKVLEELDLTKSIGYRTDGQPYVHRNYLEDFISKAIDETAEATYRAVKPQKAAEDCGKHQAAADSPREFCVICHTNQAFNAPLQSMEGKWEEWNGGKSGDNSRSEQPKSLENRPVH